MLTWVSLALFVFLGISRAVDGLLGVDVVALAFGETSATRVIYGFIGAAAVYCGIALVVRHPPRPPRHFLRRAGH
jgi:uncharacterized membrane protein YuzA (DUF378 family)